jgi:metal-dependent amidase/aminoacylase/carboxypeptidase family protein
MLLLLFPYSRPLQPPPTFCTDFSFVAEHVPSTFFLLGQGSGKDPDTSYGLHHPHFALDESVLPLGVELHVNLALRALRKLAAEEHDKVVVPQ